MKTILIWHLNNNNNNNNNDEQTFDTLFDTTILSIIEELDLDIPQGILNEADIQL